MRLDVEAGAGPRRVDLFSLLGPEDEERAHEDAYAWIKALRGLRVDGEPFRSRFTLRGDSLWWFAELYLHKEQAIHHAMRTLRAFEALVDRERPLRVRYVEGRDPGLVAAAAAARRIPYSGPRGPRALVRLDARAIGLSAAARLSRLRRGRAPGGRAPIAAFVHTAFWRADGRDGGAESYIGPILRALESRAGADAVRYVGVGPRMNFRARRWWDPLSGGAADAVAPIERYAPFSAMADSREIHSRRHETRRSLWTSADLRAHAVIRGVDCWPLVRDQLAGIALLQFPWSARAMDEAAAALRTIEPDVAVTYAEAGGWGRALALEARRAGVPFVGLQHGFIYRHWLNYRHEADEMRPDARNAADRGFPAPDRTLLFDEYAAAHLRQAGRFPESALAVTGSASLDDLLAAVEALGPEELDRVRRDAGAAPPRSLVVLATKEREARAALPALVEAVRGMEDVQLAIKPHPAETADVYAAAAGGAPNVRVLPARTPLPPLLRAARAIVTVNSTVAIDALALGVPSLVIGLPNNLTPFVDAGVMAGATSAEEIRAALARVLYDQEFRKSSEPGRAAVSGGGSAARSAEAILRLAKAKN
jgi:Capsule polysaccharide biosynthesis protein